MLEEAAARIREEAQRDLGIEYGRIGTDGEVD